MKLTHNEELVVDYLKGKDFTSPSKIGFEIMYGSSAWASPICLRLVKNGVLVRNNNGHYKLADIKEDLMTDKIYAPWTDERVDILRRHQQLTFVHPYTCGTDGCDGVLIPTRNGWVCPKCDYTQNWAWAYGWFK